MTNRATHTGRAGFSMLEVMIASTIMVGILVMTFSMIATGQRAYDYGVANTLHLTVGRNLMELVTQEMRNGIKTTVRIYNDGWNQIHAYQDSNRTTVSGTAILFQQSMGLGQDISDPVIFYRAPLPGEVLDGVDNNNNGYADEAKLIRWWDRGPAGTPAGAFWDLSGAPTSAEVANDAVITLGRWLGTGYDNPADYAGTATLTPGSNRVVGSGTAWKTTFNGAIFTLNSPAQSDGNLFSCPIQAVTNLPGTVLTLSAPYPSNATAVTGGSYGLRQEGLRFTYDGNNKITVSMHIQVKDNYGIIVTSTIVQDVVMRNN